MFGAGYFGKRYFVGTYYPPPEVSDQPETEIYSGGFYGAYDREMARRQRLRRKQKRREEAIEAIEDQITRNIAQELRKQEAIDAQRKELDRLAALVRLYQDIPTDSERVAAAVARVRSAEVVASLSRLERELQRIREEEELLLAAMMLLAD